MPVIPTKVLGIAIDDIVMGSVTIDRIILYIMGLLVIPVFIYCVNIYYHYTMNKLGQDILYKLREQYLEHLFELDSSIYEKYTKGDLIARISNDLTTVSELSRKGVNMGAGEKQIISLARAIIRNPSILIMNEATSHIDTETENIIKQSLEYACKNKTVIVIAHRLSTIYNADNIIVLDHGIKVEEGNHDSLVKKMVFTQIYIGLRLQTSKILRICKTLMLKKNT